MTTAEIQTSVATISIEGADLPAPWYDALLELHVELEFRVPGRATLRFLDDGYSLVSDSKAKLGADVTVGARRPGQTTDDVLLSGQITGLGVEQEGGGPPELVIVVHDRAHLLARGTSVNTFLNSSYADIVRSIAQRHGLRATVSAPGGTFDYAMQVESDLALLNAIADRTGCDWWVQDKTLHFSRPGTGQRSTGKQSLVLGQNLVAFSVRASGLHVDKVKVEGWDRKKQTAVSATASASGASATPDSAMFAPFVTPHGKLGPHGGATLRTATIPVQSQDEAQHVADSLRDAALYSSVVATGTVVHGSQLGPGVQVGVVDAGPTSGSYYVTKVDHVFREQFLTRFVAGDRRPSTLVDTLGSGGLDPLTHGGLVVGQVTNVNDAEKGGRIKVRYPGVDDQQESGWARALTLGGGDKRGLVILPEVGDEVLVGFENGDLRQPVVLGGLFGDKSTIPLWDVGEDGKVTGRRLTSRLGHVVELKDGTTPPQQYVLLQLAGEKHLVRLAKDKLDIQLPSGVPFNIKVGDNASLVFDAAGSLAIKAVNISLEAQGTLTMTSKAPAKIESDATLTLQGQLTALKGSVVQVQSSGPATIKGTPVAIN